MSKNMSKNMCVRQSLKGIFWQTRIIKLSA